MGNIPHSPQNTRKIASSLLERDFFYCVLQRPAASGKGCRNKVTKSLLKNQLDRILDEILQFSTKVCAIMLQMSCFC